MPQALPYSQVVAADGTATITVKVSNGISRWIITQIGVEQPEAPAGATGMCRVNGNLISPFIPTADVLGGDPPIELFPVDTLTLKWTGCTPGKVAKAYVFREEVN